MNKALERQYEAYMRLSPPSNHQLRQVGIHTVNDYPPSSISSPFPHNNEYDAYCNNDKAETAIEGRGKRRSVS